MDMNVAKERFDSGDVDGAGKEMGLDRVSIASGHGFDETDASYRRRVMAGIYGVHTAEATHPRESEEAEPTDGEGTTVPPDVATTSDTPPAETGVAANEGEVGGDGGGEGDPNASTGDGSSESSSAGIDASAGGEGAEGGENADSGNKGDEQLP